VENGPGRVDAITATADGWLLSDADGLWRSSDGLAWTKVEESKPALVLLSTPEGVWAGGEFGVERVN
jgi:hypothetical protein